MFKYFLTIYICTLKRENQCTTESHVRAGIMLLNPSVTNQNIKCLTMNTVYDSQKNSFFQMNTDTTDAFKSKS